MINQQNRNLRIILIAVAIVAMILLSAGLSQITLDAGIPFADLWAFLMNEFSSGLFMRPAVMGTAESELIIRIIQIIYFIAFASFPIVVVLVIISPEMRKTALRMLIQFAIIALALSLFTQNRAQEIESEETFGSREQLAPPTAGEIPLIAEEFQSQVSETVVWIASLMLALLIAGIVIFIISRLRKDRTPKSPFESLATRAESAAESLRKGGDFRDTILRCYADMNRIAREHRGLQREESLTAREFKDYLVKAGLPEAPVHDLTALFEEVRYGHKTYSDQEAQRAVNSLQAIATACRSPA
jgi:hypothetical protein